MATDEPAEATIPPLTDDLKERAFVLGMCVRNALEGTLHGGELGDLSLTDEQMKLLNPLVRNAIVSGLHAETHYLANRAARSYLNVQRLLVPDYWEPPELLDEYLELWQYQDVAADPTCRRCGRIIFNRAADDRPRWTHLAADGSFMVGCRAASFTTEDGWNDDLPRSWKAAPSTD